VDHFRKLCGGGAPPADLAERGLDCDPQIPRYDMDEWMAKHGLKAPDHPAVFVNTHTNETGVFPDMETFLRRYGDVTVEALPEYATSGGALKNPASAGHVTASFRQLLESWNDTFVYFSDFKCKRDSLCHTVAEEFGIPELFGRAKTVRSRNFLVGGPDSGLPFHKHGMTWQSLSMGRKAWYLLPPGSMSEEIHDATGPYIFPVRSYHALMQQRRLGKRPLYCVQHPGETLFVPEYWWHSTMNLDRYQVAYGEKPIKEYQSRSPELTRIMEFFPLQAYDSAGFSSRIAGGASGNEDPMPYALMARTEQLRQQCSVEAMDGTAHGLELPMSRLRNLTGTTLMQCGLADTAAWAHCYMAKWVKNLPQNCSDRLDRDTVRRLQQDANERSLRWRRAARELSPQLFERERAICAKGTIGGLQ